MILIFGSDEVQASQERYRHKIDRGTLDILYNYGESIVEGPDLGITTKSISVPGFGAEMPLDHAKTKYSDLIKLKLHPKDESILATILSWIIVPTLAYFVKSLI